MKMPLALLIAAALVLPGCGLHPLYAGGESGPVASRLSSISVAPIPDRAGWLVRNALLERVGAERSAGAVYRLEVELDDDISGFGIRGDSAITRERRTLRARYRLVAIGTDETLLDATASADAGIDVVSSEYATVAAEQSASERLAKVLADQIVARLGLYVSRLGEPGAAATR